MYACGGQKILYYILCLEIFGEKSLDLAIEE